jgi:hypothetical protein
VRLPILGICAFVSLAAVLEAQTQSTINGPVAGYVFDKVSEGLRPILGLPGASLFGSPVGFGYKVTAAFVAPKLDSSFAVASDGSSHLFRIQSGAVQEVSVGGLARAGFSYIAEFSPSGTAMALYTGGSVQFLTGLPGAPTVAGSVDLTQLGRPDALALSDDGTALLVSANNAITLFGSYASLGKLMDTAANPVMAFAAGTHDAAVSDTGAGVVLFQDLTGSVTSQVVAPPDQKAAPSSALAFSADGKSIYLASSSAQTITQLDLAAGTSNRLPCGCSPTALARLGNVFRVTELSAAVPLWLLDTPAGGARLVFVPALAPSTAPTRFAPIPRDSTQRDSK